VNLELLLLTLVVILFLIVVVMDLLSSRFFKKNENDYNHLLSEYRRKGYDLDLVTNYASFFGSFANYQKIIWFIRLRKGVKMKFTNVRYVQSEAYEYIRNLPDGEFDWMLKLHRYYIIQACVFTLWIVIGLIFISYIE